MDIQNCEYETHKVDETQKDELEDQSEILFQTENFGTYGLKDQLKVSEDLVVATLVNFDDTHKRIENFMRES